MDWILTTLQWYFPLLIIGIIFTPLTKKIFKNFNFDSGYPFAKTLGIILLSYLVYVLGIIKILPFNRISLFLIIVIFALINFFIYRKNLSKVQTPNLGVSTINHLSMIVFEELLFIFSLFLWTFVR
ncbi:hypothetical protein HZA75_07565, partial [Candidatus Roizmanbacteria bacterium]|nr:hypothetical protein [Candidatus Roizmanbacteria bacterium]